MVEHHRGPPLMDISPENIHLTMGRQVRRSLIKKICPFCSSLKVRKIVPKTREHVEYVPPNSRRCMTCKRSWWTPVSY